MNSKIGIRDSEPSAPPMSETYRVVQPFYIIGADEVSPLVDDGDRNAYGEDNSNRTISKAYAAQCESAVHSKSLNYKITRSNKDGNTIVQEEHLATIKSTPIACTQSAILDRKIASSNRDNVEDLEIRSVPHVPPAYIANPLETSPTFTIASKTPLTTTSTPSKPGEYQIGEYKSIYETQTPSSEGYVMKEYKSMYD